MIPGFFLGVRVPLALDANVARIIAGLVPMGVSGITLLAPKLQLQSGLVLPTGITSDFSARLWQASGRWRDRLFSYVCLQRDRAESASKARRIFRVNPP